MKWVKTEEQVGENTYLTYVLHTDQGTPLPAVVEEWSAYGTCGSVARYASTREKDAVRFTAPRWLIKVNCEYRRRTPHYPTDLVVAQQAAEEELRINKSTDAT